MEAALTGGLRRFDAAQAPRKLGPTEGKAVALGPLGVRFMIFAEESGGGVSLVEHPMPPRTLAAPLHRHAREDEYSYVLEGRMGAQLGDEVIEAEQGDLVFKPREQWHTFWNAGAAMAAPDFQPGKLGAIGARYGLEFRPESVQPLCAEHGLDHPLLHMG